MPDVDERAGAVAADEEAADLFERLLGRRQTDALQRPPAQGLEPLEGQRQVREPRLSPVIAWISSTMTVRIVDSSRRPPRLVSSR
ncbi:MAG: hypothetical protein R3F30_07470 [Planctomycetota bacterium]